MFKSMIFHIIFLIILFSSHVGNASDCAAKLDLKETEGFVSKLVDCLKVIETENNNLRTGTASTTQIAVAAPILKISYATEHGPTSAVKDGRIVSRSLRFFKEQDESEVRIMYIDNLRVTGAPNVACRWSVKVDGTDCGERRIFVDRHEGHPVNIHAPSVALGYCTNLEKGWHVVNVWVSPVPTEDNKYEPSQCVTGWNAPLWTIEAVELTASPHDPN